MKEFIELKIFLMKIGISQTKLAQETGLHKNTISKFLNTGNGTKSTKELIRLYLGLDKNEFSNLING
jgi:plasmid maintenance system antidote protein VapI